MKIHQIQRMPQSSDELTRSHLGEVRNIHESCFRSYQILEKVKELIEHGTPSAVIKELIEEMEFKSDQGGGNTATSA
jgi:hypothetical protein